MSFTDIFIKRPVLALSVNVLLLVAGYQAYLSLSVRQYPKSDVAVVTVRTAYVGADPDLVRGFVTTPLERAIASADGIDYLESRSEQGLSTISARLRLNFPPNDALTQIQAKVAQVRNDLPPEAEAPIINVENADTQFALLYLSFSSPKLRQNEITDYLIRVVQPQLSAVPGVQRADILGARTFAMRVWLKPERLAAFNVTPLDVRDALASNNVLAAAGNAKGNMVTMRLTADTNLTSVEEFKALVVRQEETRVVRLGDIAEVALGAETYDEDVRFSGETATFMGIWALPNANSLEVIERVRAELPAIEKNLPPGMKLAMPYDATAYIRDALSEVTKTLLETVVIVIVVIYLFIGSLRSVLVPVVAIPLSLIGAFALMSLFGFTLNLLTLLAIVLAVGLVVDDAIVVLENAERHVRMGKKPREAALIAARELVVPIIAMTITLVAVYAPIGFQGGLTGALFREFALTLAGAVAISGFVALTLSPMMASRLVTEHGTESPFQLKVGTFLAGIRSRYEGSLRLVLERRVGVVTAAAGVVLLLPPLYLFSTKELAPREDQGVLFAIIQASPSASLEQTLLSATKVTDAFLSFPEAKQTFQITNSAGGFGGMLAKPWSDRERSVFELEPEAWAKTGVLPGVRAIVTSPPPLPGGSDFPVELVISSTGDDQVIAGLGEQLVQHAMGSGLFMFADTDVKFDQPASQVTIDRERVAAVGLRLVDVADHIGILTGGDFVNRFSIAGRSYKVIPQLERRARLNPEQILNTYLRIPSGEMLALSNLATITPEVAPRFLGRFQQLNSVKIQGAIPPGVTIDQGLTVLEEKAGEILPPGYRIDYAGESRQLRTEGGAGTATLILAIFLIFLVLAAQFESFRDPLIILAGSVPLALAGAMVFVFLNATTLNIYSQVGLVTLVGLIAKNGILIVEFANLLKEEGRSVQEAIVEAAATRLRPVLMTSVATVVGHFPLILASGAGAGARNSIGIVLVSGMIIGTILTLFVVPVLYALVAAPHRKG